MKETLNRLDKIFTINGFQKQQQNIDKTKFGNLITVYENKDVSIRVIVDRSVLCVEFSSKEASSQWFDLQLIKAIYGPVDLTKEFIVSDNIEWIEVNLNRICKDFQKPNDTQTQNRLHEPCNKRAALLFPGWYNCNTKV